MRSFNEYLSQPCDAEGCEETATHTGYRQGVTGGPMGDWCNRHTDRDRPAFARND